MARLNNYGNIIVRLFTNHYYPGATEFEFERDEFVKIANELEIKLPKNLGDVIYSFRFRNNLPKEILSKAPQGKVWRISLAGRGRYKFIISDEDKIIPSQYLEEIKIPDSTPGLISLYAYSDEQALLAILRYNRLLDIFTGKTCYSLQNHLRTTVKDLGQVETDEIYVGLDQEGVQYVFPVQAKGKTDKIGLVQVEQDFALCNQKFSKLRCVPIAAQFISNELIALFSFVEKENKIRISSEKHYRLVPTDDATPDEFMK